MVRIHQSWPRGGPKQLKPRKKTFYIFPALRKEGESILLPHLHLEQEVAEPVLDVTLSLDGHAERNRFRAGPLAVHLLDDLLVGAKIIDTC